MAFLKPKEKSYCFWSHISSGSMKISERLRQLRITHGDPIHRGILQYKYCECEYIIKSLLITHWHPLNSVEGNQAIQNLKILAQFVLPVHMQTMQQTTTKHNNTKRKSSPTTSSRVLGLSF